MSTDLVPWLESHGLNSPHAIPEGLQEEFDDLFDDLTILWPQPGGQEQFQACTADIALYGGEAGAGKSWNLLADHIKWIHLPEYIGTVVRKTYSQIFDAGGLWEEAKKVFGPVGGKATRGDKPKFVFPSGAQVYFKHSQHASKVDEYWQGLQSAQISMDELTHFEKDEFLYIMSRNRSVSGVNSYMRMTCNPDPSSWVKKLIAWWIDDDGFIIPERSGVVRHFVHRDDKFIFADTPGELEERFGIGCLPKSFTFIRGYLEENKKLLEADPGYMASLENLSRAQRRALREGNWDEVDNPDAMFTRANFDAHRVDKCDFEGLARIVIGVDPAGGTKESNDDTGIVGAGVDDDGHCFVFSDKTGKYKPLDWAKESCDLYDLYKADMIVAERNYGGDMVESTINSHRKDIHPKLVTSSKGKALRAEPVSALYDKGMVYHVGHGLEELEEEMANFRPGQSKSPNRLDALVFAITELALKQAAEPRIRQF